MPSVKDENTHLSVKFRKDINLLRAFAVTAVILFHFDFGFALGGYLGVDVFFVISGYLMTSIILSRLTQKRFSLVGFYISRLLRIVPALVALCLVLTVVGWFLIFPYDYAYLARNINHALTFKSNISFSGGAGYFDTGTDIKWLLHTWSLSVEMQFYLIYPIVLLLLNRLFGLTGIRVILMAAMLVSLGAYIWTMQYGNPNHAFYLLPNRAWQLLAGAVTVVFPIFSITDTQTQNVKPHFFRIAGIGLIVISAIFGVGNGAFAVVWALLSTIGTVFILATPACLAGISIPGAPYVRNIAHYIGLISYSLYLWHWPVRSFQEYLGYEESVIATSIALFVTVASGALSFHLVEKTVNALSKSRDGRGIKWRPVVAIVVSVSALLLVYGSAKTIREKDGIVQRLDSLPFENIPTYLFKNPELYLLEGIADKCSNNGTACRLTNGERVSNEGEWKPDLILSGDSHAMAVAHALSETPYENRHLNLLLSGSAACIYFNGFDQTLPGDRKFERCKRAYSQFLKILDETPQSVPLLFANFFPKYLTQGRWSNIRYEEGEHGDVKPLLLQKAWLDMVCQFSKKREVFIMKSVPSTSIPVVKTIVQNVLKGTITTLNQATFDTSVSTHQKKTLGEETLLEMASQKCGVTLIDPSTVLCENGICHGTSTEVVPLYRDSSHLNLYGSRKLIPLFEETFAVTVEK